MECLNRGQASMHNACTEPYSTSSGASTSELLILLTKSLIRLLRAGGLADDQIVQAVSSSLVSDNSESRPTPPVVLGRVQRECMEIMCLWRRDPDFLFSDGTPAILGIDSGPNSFQDLCERAGTRTAPTELLTTLAAFGAVVATDADHVMPATPTFLLSGEPGRTPVAFDGVLKQMTGFLRVIEHNVLKASSDAPRRFERACTVVVARELLPVFERLVADRGQDFIDAADEWLERHAPLPSPTDAYVEVGVGAYFVDLGEVSRQPFKNKDNHK